MGVLDGKVAIVTGAGTGLGKGIAQELVGAGAGVAVLEIDPESAAASRRSSPRPASRRGRIRPTSPTRPRWTPHSRLSFETSGASTSS